jgi:hypothetical protein
LPLHLCLPMVCARIKELRFLYSCCGTFTTRKTAMPSVPRPKPTQWTVLSLGVRPPQMLFWSTTLKINVTTNQTVIKSALTAYHLQSILQLYMTEVYLSPYIAGMFRSSANLTLRELGSKNPAQATIPSAGLAPSWTFQLTLPPCHSTSSCLTTAPPNPPQLGICHLSFLNHKQLPPILPCLTFSLRFFASTPR